MQLVKQTSKVWGECPSAFNESILWIEKAGRVCYRSEDKIVEGSGIKFVDNITTRKHYSVLEHSNIVIKQFGGETDSAIMQLFLQCPFINVELKDGDMYVGGNWRSFLELLTINYNSVKTFFDNVVPDGFELVTDHKEVPRALKRITVEFETDRAVTHELVRHRPASYLQESQRYVKYGNVKFIEPVWFNNTSDKAKNKLIEACDTVEMLYGEFLSEGLRPEKARVILPNLTYTKIIVTANLPEWDHIFHLRCSKAAYPQIRQLIEPVQKEFLKY